MFVPNNHDKTSSKLGYSILEINYITARPYVLMRPQAQVRLLAGCTDYLFVQGGGVIDL